MSANDTAALDTTAIEVEVIEPDAPADDIGLGALLGGLDLGAMMGMMGLDLDALTPDPEADTIADVMDELAELRACIDYIARGLIQVADNVPARWRPDLGPYPPPLD